MRNRLAEASSPYLQQHAANPVEWYPWGADAFAAAHERDVPILLSVGYAACHWCHVMAHESFENETTARMMNERFVNVKVDREERPDVDSIYMQAVQAITGQGGWPMTVFLTPEGVPFFGGTYFPPEDRHGLPSFQRILVSVAEAWRTKRAEVESGALQLRTIYEAAEAPTAAGAPFTATTWRESVSALSRWYDPRAGGFGSAPKFPQPHALDALLRQWARTENADALAMVQHSFTQMWRGGLYDQLGGGFHRYTVDAVWLVPHFEKMLYDNASLARLGVQLWQATGDADAKRVALETFAWARREMLDPAGGWYASLDADSEGHEGKFYVWQEQELRTLLGDDADLAFVHWGVSRAGNFEGANILHVAVPLAEVAARTGRTHAEVEHVIARARARLFEARAPRVRPARDEKVLASWNGLMLRAVAEGARAFDDAALREDALRAAAFLRDEMIRDARVLRSWRSGRASIPGFLEDHAAVALAFIAVHQLTFDRAWLDLAHALHASCVRWFWSDDSGSWFDAASDAEPLVTRPRDLTDNATPAGNSLAVELDLAMRVLRGDVEAGRRAEYVLATLSEPVRRSALAFGHLLAAADGAVHGATELALLGAVGSDAFRALERTAAGVYLPALMLAGGDGAQDLPLLEGRDAGPTGAQAFVCRGFACELPTSDPDALRAQLLSARRA